MSRMFARIRWHLVGWTMLVVGLILALVGGAVHAATTRSLLEQVDRNLAGLADQAADNPRAVLSGFADLDREGYRGSVFYLAVDDDGRVVANPQRVEATRIDLAGLHRLQRGAASAEVGGEPVRLYARPLGPPRDDGPGRGGPPGGGPGPPGGRPVGGGPGGGPGAARAAVPAAAGRPAVRGPAPC